MKYDSDKYKVYTWKNWMVLHYILNPGIAINELLFGQRVPKISVVDKTSEKPLIERSYVPCPNCETLHDGRTWSSQNGTAFRNWFGLYCPNCGEIIPCLMNLTTWLILATTFPLWGWYRNSLKRKWLEKQPARFSDIKTDDVINPFDGSKWLIEGLSWGVVTSILVIIFFPLIGVDMLFVDAIFTAIAIIVVGGPLFGLTMKLYFSRTGTKKLT